MMQDVFSKLKSLQEVLSKKFEIEQEIRDIPKVLNTKTELLNRLKKSYVEKNGQVEETKEQIRRLRIRLDDAEHQREGYEKQMDQISTQREYEALDKEIKDATEKEQHLRKEILRQEKELEELSYSLEQEESMIRQQEEELHAEQERIELESEDKRILLRELEKEEQEISPGLDEEILFKFERIIRSKAGLGIVPVKDSVCTGCHMMLPAQFENDVRSGENILFCPYCSRILFYEEEEIATGDFVTEEDSGSLTDLVNLEDFGLDE
ncbi:zinc ribbon domain-containing protein [Sediminispirochaeta bajacaliforniensis]|uniref:zinc ribbon domain-containing protein n=1 Tax=Sediminispirochaeta bajacaliforniensis TaxID=148 RepID=UPI00036AC470|nr:C4-type zinc ribbon domain-containing protein [Sediminispirochaeta bajacaliforniensis]